MVLYFFFFFFFLQVFVSNKIIFCEFQIFEILFSLEILPGDKSDLKSTSHGFVWPSHHTNILLLKSEQGKFILLEGEL